MTNIKEVTPFYHSLSGDTEEDKKLLEPFKYILQCNEKREYTKITSVFNYWLKIPSDKLRQIDEIIHISYNVCIALDDIQDNSIMREGYPVTHSIYGLGNTINAANYVQFVAFEKLANLHPAATQIFIEEMLECYRTQGIEIYLTNNFICPTEKDYKIMATRKSSWTVKLAVRLMKLFSTYEGDISSLISAFGMYYQIRNDYCNFFHKNDNGKSYCDDLTEGKFSLPIIHAINSNPDDTQIINILKQHTTDIEMKRHCVKLLDSFGSLKYTRDLLEELDKKVRIEIEYLGGNPLFMKVMDELKNKMPKTHAEMLNSETRNQDCL